MANRIKLTREALDRLFSNAQKGLIKEYNTSGGFRESITYTRKGPLEKDANISSTCTGAISLAMIVANYYELDKNLGHPNADVKDAVKIISEIINKNYQYLVDNDFILNVETIDIDNASASEKMFQYIDTVTLFLSLSAIVTYINHYFGAVFSADVIDKAYDIYAKMLTVILDSQLEIGAWGVVNSPEIPCHLFSTYSVGCSLADVFDYSLGELNDRPAGACENPMLSGDTNEIVQNIVKHMFTDITDSNAICNSAKELIGRLKEARKKLAFWLIYNELPLLPFLSNCTFKNEYLGSIPNSGLWGISNESEAKYNFLYFSYYIINLIVTCNADNYFRILTNDMDSEFNKDKQYYSLEVTDSEINDFENKFKESCQDIWEIGRYSSLYNYYFESDDKDRLKSMCSEILNQSIHSSRSLLDEARRTGDGYWDDPSKSSLSIKFRIDRILTDGSSALCGKLDKMGMVDASIIPLAIRANVMYCYYIIESRDTAAEEYFKILNDTVITDSNLDGTGLWDVNGYDIDITEKCLEALLDYSDYVIEYTDIPLVGKEASLAQITSLDSFIEQLIEGKIDAKLAGTSVIDESYIARIVDEKISEKLSKTLSNSDDSHIEDLISARIDSLTSSEDFPVKSAIFKEIASMIKRSGEIIHKSANESAYVKAFNDLTPEARELCRALREVLPPVSIMTSVSGYATDDLKMLNERYNQLSARIIADIDGDGKDAAWLASLYESVKRTNAAQNSSI